MIVDIKFLSCISFYALSMITHDMESLTWREYKTQNIFSCKVNEVVHDVASWNKRDLDAYPLAIRCIFVPKEFNKSSFFRSRPVVKESP